MPISQKNRPIILILQGGEFFSLGIIPVPFLFGSPGGIVRPENLQILRPARGTVVHTAGAAFLDDFGEGVGTIVMQGHTGWSEPALAGEVAFQQLRLMFQEYLARRKRTKLANLDPDGVRLIYLDSLNLEAFLVYPHEFSLKRSRTRPLLYMYHLRLSILRDLLQEGVSEVTDFLGDFFGTALSETQSLITEFSGVA
jgi:hypothetical protein